MIKRFRNKNRKVEVKSVAVSKPVIKARLFLWVLLAVFVGLQVYITIETSASGASLAQLEKEEYTLTTKNKELTEALVESNSLSKVSGKAQELGFVKPERTVYINDEDFVAKSR